MKKFTITFALCVLTGLAMSQPKSSEMKTYALRLKPGQDLKLEIENFLSLNHIKAGAILTCAGSLTEANIRFANQPEGTLLKGHFEIASLTGTLSTDGNHIHISISDETGKTTGGHLLAGNLIYTTAEIVIGELVDLEFKRETDSTFGYKELKIYSKHN
jgi:uncharacterized protein